MIFHYNDLSKVVVIAGTTYVMGKKKILELSNILLVWHSAYETVKMAVKLGNEVNGTKRSESVNFTKCKRRKYRCQRKSNKCGEPYLSEHGGEENLQKYVNSVG